jgi:cell division protein FtsI/penicillin-binding protein 2
MGERAGKLFALIALSFAVLVARLAFVQLGQHDVWAEEAARLVHKGLVIPYRRGEIRFAGGEVAARDVEAYRLSFAYRPFRRDHPLGQIAHARTALELRSVTLRETERNLVRWGAEIVELHPAALDAFARGAALVTDSLAVPATDDPGAEDRRGRASDVRFYVRALLGATKGEARALEKRAASARDLSYAELIAAERGVEHAALVAELRRRWESSLEHLAFLAAESDLGGDEGASPYETLLDALEESRRAVDGAGATALFEAAAGFPPGRLAPESLLEGFDLEELRVILRWDRRDLGDWARRTRASWRASWRDGYALPRLVAELTLDPAAPPDADRIVSTLASVFGTDADLEAALAGRPTDWRAVDALAGLSDLGDVFRADAPRDLVESLEPVLPFQDPELRRIEAPIAWPLLDEMRLPVEAAAFPGDWVAAWKTSVASNRASARELRFALAKEMVDGWERAYQAAVAQAVSRLLAGADADDRGPRGGLSFRRGRLERLAERASYVLKDYGMRERALDADPSYDVVFLLTRFPERYPGFFARDARRREIAVLDGDEHPLAERLLGFVSRADVRAMQRQRADAARMRELRRSPNRTPAEEDELAALIESVLLPDEVGGVAGVEGFFDPELRGHNGYREIRGQDDVREARAERRARDGLDVTLTLDAALQRAAERVINAPTAPVDDPSHDPAWYRRPVGAIVLLTVEGDVLAAASSPDVDASDASFGDPALSARPDGDVIPALERTMRRPTFQPPGSVFKPFVAAWALDHDHLDPSALVNCSVMADGRVGYVDVRCWNSVGHGHVDLREALKHSCNAYFAHLGESLSMDDLRGIADAFGFGRPTGIATPPGGRARAGGRTAHFEDVSSYLFQRELTDGERRRAGNGLAVVEATPMQVARGFAGLATGLLPDVRIVSAVGGAPVPRAAPRPVPISRAALERVREALLAVANEGGGTAQQVLSADRLGFTVAAKTGSADLADRADRDEAGRVRKHTWVAGYAPVDEPRFVVVIFIHDTEATSSHGAVHVAAEFLEQPEVRAYLAGLGIALEEPR